MTSYFIIFKCNNKFFPLILARPPILTISGEHFANLSHNLAEVLKDTKTTTQTLYLQYCPMKKAYWLSESSKIKNPYYNSGMMSSCGNTLATLTAVN